MKAVEGSCEGFCTFWLKWDKVKHISKLTELFVTDGKRGRHV
jgi:hypothetical protein